MPRLSNSIHRILWLVLNDLRAKKSIFTVLLLSCFALLTFIFFNKTLSFSELINTIISPEQIVTYSNTTIFSRSGSIFTTSSLAVPFLKYHLEYFPKALFILGFVFTSLTFTEYAAEPSRRFYVSLPSKTWEKWCSKVILTAVVFPVAFLVFYQLFALMTYKNGALQGYEYVKLHFFDPYIWRHIFLYVGMQCFIFMGASYFKKHSFFKVLLVVLATYFALTVLLNFSVLVLFPDLDFEKMGSYINRYSYLSYLHEGGLTIEVSVFDMMPSFLTTVPYLGWCYLMGVMALGISYLRFQELEA